MAEKTKLWYLHGLNILKGMDEKSLKLLSSESHMRQTPKREIIYFPEESSDTIYFLKEGKIKIVYNCGPEVMMKKVLELCNKYNVQCEGSVERYMKCAFGICGACAIDDKFVCYDGPIFNKKQLNELKEFGKFARLKIGKKVTIKEYHT